MVPLTPSDSAICITLPTWWNKTGLINTIKPLAQYIYQASKGHSYSLGHQWDSYIVQSMGNVNIYN